MFSCETPFNPLYFQNTFTSSMCPFVGAYPVCNDIRGLQFIMVRQNVQELKSMTTFIF